ncbi:hypothetical protein Tco_1172865 [Tanacetum coccineum]
MASQDARLSKFEANFKQQQNEMTNKIDTVLKAIIDWIAGALPSDTIKNPKLGTHPVSSARSYPNEDLQYPAHIHGSINTITIHPKQPKESQVNESNIGQEDEGNLGNTDSNPHPQPDPLASIATEQDDGEVMFIEIVRDNEPQCDDPHEVEGATTEEPVVEYFDTFPTRDELTCHRKLNPREDANGFTGRIKGMHVFVGNFTYVIDFMIVEDISSILDLRLSQVVLGKPFIEISSMTHDLPEGVVRFIRGTDEVAYKMPHKIEQYDSMSDLETEHTKSVYLRNEEDKRRGVEYVMRKILGVYKECLELGPEYLTGVDDEGEVTPVETASRLTSDAVTTTPVTGSHQPQRRQTPRVYDDLDAYDSDCDELNTAKVALMANLSHNMINQAVLMMSFSEQSNVVTHSETEITSDSNIIPYSQSNDNISDSCAQSVEIDSLKQTLSEHLKEKESLMQTVTLLINDFKKEEYRNIDREISLEKRIKQLDNIVFKRDQST